MTTDWPKAYRPQRVLHVSGEIYRVGVKGYMWRFTLPITRSWCDPYLLMLIRR